MILSEERVLQLEDSLSEDVNDWPEYTLTDVKVRRNENATFVSLLEAKPEFPLSVTGRLSRLDKQREKLGIRQTYMGNFGSFSDLEIPQSYIQNIHRFK